MKQYKTLHADLETYSKLLKLKSNYELKGGLVELIKELVDYFIEKEGVKLDG